jgi:hypothetical protein
MVHTRANLTYLGSGMLVKVCCSSQSYGQVQFLRSRRVGSPDVPAPTYHNQVILHMIVNATPSRFSWKLSILRPEFDETGNRGQKTENTECEVESLES